MRTIIETSDSKQVALVQHFQHLNRINQLGHAYLLEGSKGTGKKQTALRVAEAIHCIHPKPDGESCGKCVNCSRILTNQHPDVIEVEPDGLSIKVDQIRSLKSELSKSGMEGNKKIVIINQVDTMTVGAANSLLKFIEEPEGDMLFFLLTLSKQRVLPTIQSRCQIFHLQPLPIQLKIRQLEARGLSTSQAHLFANLTNDDDEALQWDADEEMTQLVQSVWRWYVFLEKKDMLAFVHVQTELMSISKDREKHRLILEILLFLYRDSLRLFYDEKTTILAFIDKQAEIKKFTNNRTALKLIQCIETILQARKKLESNVPAQGVYEQLTLKITQG
ncbi:DNA polymerase III subunit delta' [Lacticigenium naphthae]|uniref:DNA polymerase III subunit delta' n=1 Tax=Lacticigenium naphthae TaxID=515351 RepID=UPI00041E2875|nr:DNA polymerase III subunit delta' [Lacticigenium naphthae]